MTQLLLSFILLFFFNLMGKYEIPQRNFAAFNFKKFFQYISYMGINKQKKAMRVLQQLLIICKRICMLFFNLVFKPILKTSNYQEKRKKFLKILKEEVEMLLLFFLTRQDFIPLKAASRRW